MESSEQEPQPSSEAPLAAAAPSEEVSSPSEPLPSPEQTTNTERRKSLAGAVRRNSSNFARRPSMANIRRKSVLPDGIQMQEELQREMMGMNLMEDALKSKWMSALETHKENFQLNMEKKKRDGMEMQKNKNLVEEVRAQRDQKKVMSVLANLEEKKEKVDEFKKRRVTIVEQARKEEQQKEESKRAWITLMRDVKSLQKERRRELEEERRRQFSVTLQRQSAIKEKLEQRKSEARKSQVEWERRISVFKIKKIKEKKKYKKRLHPPTETELRFKQLQRETKLRALREAQRKKQLEHERLMEKRKRYFQELARRAEVRARLEYLRKCQELNDFRQSVAMDRIRKQYEAKVVVQKADEKFTEKMVDMMKKNEKYLNGLKRKALMEKKKEASQLKIQKELERRANVQENVKKSKERMLQLAELKGRQLAEEEVNFLKAKEEQKMFNEWVSEQYHKKAVFLRKKERYQEHIRKQDALNQQLLKKEGELQRRKETLRKIKYLMDNKPEPLDKSLDIEDAEEIRRKVILMQRDQHKALLQEELRKKIDHGEEVRKQLLEYRDLYLKDREADYNDKKERKALVVRRAKKKAWR